MSQISQSQIDDFPRSLSYKIRETQPQEREIFVTFYPSDNSEENQQTEQSSYQETQEKFNSKDTQTGPISFRGDSFNIPLDNTKYEADFFPGRPSTQSKLIKNGDYIVVTKREFITKPKEETKVVISERTIDQLINEIGEKANKNGPFKNTTSQETKVPDVKSEALVQKNQKKEIKMEDEQSKLIQLANELSMSAYELESNINEVINEEMKKSR